MIQRYNVDNSGAWEEEIGEWCLFSDVEKLEQQNKQLLDTVIDLKSMVCALHMTINECNYCDDIKSVDLLIESITGKKPE